MSIKAETPWGEQSFTRDREWYDHLANGSGGFGISKTDYDDHHAAAFNDPAYDLFDHIMPTYRPKHDIGRYVLRHGVSVPIISSLPEWQAAIDDGVAMLRSELQQDYSGYSGLLSSVVIPQHVEYPKDEHGLPGVDSIYDNRTDQWIKQQTVEGPVRAQTNLSNMELLSGYDHERVIGSVAVRKVVHDTLVTGLYDGTVNPAGIMHLLRWDREIRNHLSNALHYNYKPVMGYADASRWRYVPGVPVRVFRDPVVSGKYFIGGLRAHDHWEVTDGRDSPDVEAYSKGVYRGAPKPDEPQYTLPTQEIIDLYEKVRTLPLFDQRQVPVVEMQYGDDGVLYFLQYLKTGLTLGDPGEFTLPESRTSVPVYSVRGATDPNGEQVRIYIDPQRLSPAMENQGILVGYELGGKGHAEQVAVMQARIAINDALNFKDNHFSSATLIRPPVALGLWDGVGEAGTRFNEVLKRRISYEDNTIEYITARVTSNGREAVIDSDWELKHD